MDNERELLWATYMHATHSPDPSTQNAAVLFDPDTGLPVGEWHYNAFPRGVECTDERWERPAKYLYVEHAERRAIYAAARVGIATEGLAMACPWAACADCARAIIEAGIVLLLTHRQAHDRSPQFWLDSIGPAMTMLAEAGVKVEYHDGLLCAPEVRHSGELWNP